MSDFTEELFWKNFNLGTELDISGAFIYNALREFDRIETFYYEEDIFEVMYYLSVGIERLEKVAIILIEHEAISNQNEFEKSLITHNHLDLFKRIESHRSIKVSTVHYKFLQLLTEFYKSMRYDRFNLSEVRNYNKEKLALINFFVEELKIEYNEELFIVTPNDDRIKKFLGRVVGKISKLLYNLICEECHRLNIYTYELRTDSKSAKIFLSEKYDFIDERYLIKELLIFLLNTKNKSKAFEFIKNIEPLDFDIALINDYLSCFLDPLNCQKVIGEAEALYEDVVNKKDRCDILNIIGSPSFEFFDEIDEDE